MQPPEEEQVLFTDEECLPKETRWAYLVGVRRNPPIISSKNFQHYSLDFFLEITSEQIATLVASNMLKGGVDQHLLDELDDNMEEIRTSLVGCSLRSRFCNDAEAFLFHSKEQLDRELLESLINTLPRNRLEEARVRI